MGNEVDHGIVVYGVSDDLIEIEGFVREEFYANYGEVTYLAFSDGTLIAIEYADSGEWKIMQHSVPNRIDIDPSGHGLDDYPDYSDVATIITDGPVEWVAKADRVVKKRDR